MDDTMSTSATFLILGDDFDLDQLSDILRLKSSQSWRKGDKRNPKQGSPHVYDYSGWKRFQDETVDKLSLEDQLRYWLKLFSGLSDQLKKLQDLNYSMGIVCFIVTDQFVSFSLEPKIVKGLAEFGMELTVECSFSQKGSFTSK